MGKGWAVSNRYVPISSMQCSLFLSAWPTSAPEIAALRSLLPILFCYFIAPATMLQDKEERRAWWRSRVQDVHMGTPFVWPVSSSLNWVRGRSESTGQSLERTVIVHDRIYINNFPSGWHTQKTARTKWPLAFKCTSNFQHLLSNGTSCSSKHIPIFFSGIHTDADVIN